MSLADELHDRAEVDRPVFEALERQEREDRLRDFAPSSWENPAILIEARGLGAPSRRAEPGT